MNAVTMIIGDTWQGLAGSGLPRSGLRGRRARNASRTSSAD